MMTNFKVKIRNLILLFTALNIVKCQEETQIEVTTCPEVTSRPWEKNLRTPNETLPIHYDLYLHPDLDTALFTGRVSIQVSVSSPMAYLVTHLKNLNVSSTKLKYFETEVGIELLCTFQYKPHEFWVIVPNDQLSAGNYTIEMEFAGSLDKKIKGFYKSVYTNEAGQQRTIATTQFQATDARQAFPCFDEPSYKSTFNVTLVRPSVDYVALSNMPEEIVTPDSPKPGLTEVRFQKSVPMVTYLACFIICDYGYVEAKTVKDKPFRVYASKNQVNRSNYALGAGVDMLNYFEQYFEIDYPLPKQDMIAIPDFSAGAMENWGLITYREAAVLYDDVGSSSYNKQRVATIVSHELAHMWFGNLVTLSWWDDLWLNEGFASYIEYKGVDQYEKDWDMLQQFVVQDLQYVFRLDSKLSSHPIVQPVDNPDQISELFDAISYSKGASVLRMLENLMGDEPFREGIRNFLRAHKFGNAVTNDLWKHLEATSTDKLPIGNIMDTWTRQMGFPVINVSRVDQDTIRVTQQRFLEDPNLVSANDSQYEYKWDIPVTYVTDTISRQLKMFYRNETSLDLPINNSTNKWVKFNERQHGYYRVNYDQSLWNELISLLQTNHETLTPADRASLLDDAFTLAAASQLNYTVAFELASYIDKETHYVPWYAIVRHLSSLNHRLLKTKAYPLYRQYILELVEHHAMRLGWNDTGSHLDRRLRPMILGLACRAGSQFCLDGALERLQKWIQDKDMVIPANLKTVVYKYGLQRADYKDWKIMLDRYKVERNSQEQSKMISGLTNPPYQWILFRLLEEARNESTVRTQDYFRVMSGIADNPSGTQIAWDFIKKEWQYLVDRFLISSTSLGRLVKRVVSEFTTSNELQDAKDFFESQPEAGAGERARKQAIEEVEKIIGWLDRNNETLYQWLSLNVVKKV